jgi:cytochrome c oxidase cbb3-type subunit III
MGPPLERAEWRYGGTDSDLYASIAGGRPGGMPGWDARLTEEQIWKLVEYLRLLQ